MPAVKDMVYRDPNNRVVHFEVWVDGEMVWEKCAIHTAVDSCIESYLAMRAEASRHVGPFFAGRVVKRRLYGTVKRARQKAARKRRGA